MEMFHLKQDTKCLDAKSKFLNKVIAEGQKKYSFKNYQMETTFARNC